MAATDAGQIQPSLSDGLPSRGRHHALEPPASPWIIELAGGVGAPARARNWVLARLSGAPLGISRADVAVVVSELVTNSVVHAHVDASQLLKISVATVTSRWRITVSDPGSETEPHVRTSDGWSPGGLGLRVVDTLCAAWGTSRDADGARHVWCELPSVAPAAG